MLWLPPLFLFRRRRCFGEAYWLRRVHSEPPRILWRLQLLREWSHEQEGNQVFPGSPRARSASGARAA
ncbi:hypothetical protein DIE21_01270 [Burkholderia sp. Bp9140]|nr:hypothetical protein DIE21_01270 [Burkholderia sp. Bp9140]